MSSQPRELPSPPDAVLCDLGSTLLGAAAYDGLEGMRKLFRYAVGTPPAEREALAARAAALETQILGPADDSIVQMTTAAALRLIADVLGVRFSIPLDEMVWELWRGAIDYRPEPGVESALNALAARGIPLGVLSNNYNTASVLQKELARHDLVRFFRVVLSSADYGLRKPTPLVFHAACRRLGSEPSRTWYIGDHPDIDVAGARSAGLVAVWYNPRGLPAPAPPPHLTLGSWTEIVPLLDALG